VIEQCDAVCRSAWSVRSITLLKDSPGHVLEDSDSDDCMSIVIVLSATHPAYPLPARRPPAPRVPRPAPPGLTAAGIGAMMR